MGLHYPTRTTKVNSFWLKLVLIFTGIIQRQKTSIISQKKDKERKQILLSANFLLVAFGCLIPEAEAQIVPDATLPVNSIVTPQGNTNLIEGGTPAGSNLFHSFREFSIPTGSEAFFNNGLDIQNIFSRVTGSNLSNIDGLIRANGTTNLFLINPNGIIFGQNARLNIGGSFLASTASSIKFADGLEFSATNPQTSSSLLTVNVPVGLQYGANTREIRVQGKGQEFGLAGTKQSFDNSLNPLEVLPGKSLTLVGGNVIIGGGILQVPGGRVELGGIAGEGTIGLNGDGSLSFPDEVVRADVSISNKAGINVLGAGGGSIEITAKNINILEESLLSGGIGANLEANRPAGDIILNATEAIGVNSSGIENIVNPNAIGNSGNIEITAKSLSVTGGAKLTANTRGKGDAGSVKIAASDIVSFAGRVDGFSSTASSRVEKGAEGKAGGIEITAKSVSFTGGAALSAGTRGKGDAESIKITASDIVSLDGGGIDGFPSAAFSTVETGGEGKGGDIEITAKSVSVTGGALLDASTFGKGDAGNVNITASDIVSFDGGLEGFAIVSAALSRVEEGAEGKGGGIEITAKSVSVTGGAALTASTLGKGDAGSVKITASDIVSFDGGVDGFPSTAFSSVEKGGEGKGGSIEITAKSVSVNGDAQLVATTFDKGDAGSVKITASDVVSFDGGSAFSSVAKGGEGKGGGIEITAKSVSVTGGAALSAGTRGKGDAGSVKITASDRVSFDGSVDGFSSAAFSTVREGAEGKGGGIEITTGSLTITNGAGLSATSAGNGSAGEIVVEAVSILLENQGLIISDTTGGAGNIRLDAPAITLRGSSITTNATGGDSGGDINLSSEFVQLRSGSRIATDASGADVKGGNITINTDILAALENSDISANSVNSLGGNVIINAQSIFGAQSRTREELQTLLNTDDSNLLDPKSLLSSDITATGANSALSGTITINTLDVDRSSGLVDLPDNVDATALVASTCRRGPDSNQFIVTGRGGLPLSPYDALNEDATWMDLRLTTVPIQLAKAESGLSKISATLSDPEVVEAQGWKINPQGEVILVAEVLNVTPANSGLMATQCQQLLGD